MTTTIRQGRLVSLEGFKRHAWLILIAMVVILGLIGQRYSNQTKMQQIKRLTHELAREQSAERVEKAQYMTLIRESEMRRLIRAKGLDLDFREQPPYVIPKE